MGVERERKADFLDQNIRLKKVVQCCAPTAQVFDEGKYNDKTCSNIKSSLG